MSAGLFEFKGVQCDDKDCRYTDLWNPDADPGHNLAPPRWVVVIPMPGGRHEFFCPSCAEDMLERVNR
jgi:hypothetical protein